MNSHYLVWLIFAFWFLAGVVLSVRGFLWLAALMAALTIGGFAWGAISGDQQKVWIFGVMLMMSPVIAVYGGAGALAGALVRSAGTKLLDIRRRRARSVSPPRSSWAHEREHGQTLAELIKKDRV